MAQHQPSDGRPHAVKIFDLILENQGRLRWVEHKLDLILDELGVDAPTVDDLDAEYQEIEALERAFAAHSYHRLDPFSQSAQRRRQRKRNRIRGLREASGMTQRQVAAHIGVAPSFIGRMERGGERVPDRHRDPLAELFAVSVAWLLGEEDELKPRL